MQVITGFVLSRKRTVQDQSGITAIIQAVPVLQRAQDLASDFKTHGLMMSEYTI